MRSAIAIALAACFFRFALCADDATSQPLWMGKTPSEWIDRLNGEYIEDRFHAAKLLMLHKNELDGYIPHLVKALSATDDRTGSSIVELFDFIKFDDKSLVSLIEITNREKKGTILALGDFFGRLDDQRTLPLLITALQDNKLDKRVFAVIALAKNYGQCAVCKALLLKAMFEDDDDMREYALRAFEARYPDDFLEIGKKLDQVTDEKKKLIYVRSIAHMGGENAIPELIRIWKTTDRLPVQYGIARAIESMARNLKDANSAIERIRKALIEQELEKQFLEVLGERRGR